MEWAETAEQAAPYLSAGQIDAVLIDVSPRNGGVATLAEVRTQAPGAAVVALSDLAH